MVELVVVVGVVVELAAAPVLRSKVDVVNGV